MAALRRRDARHRWALHFGPSMTPMVDVVLVILIFFMASAALVGPEFMLEALIPRPREAEASAQRSASGTPTLPRARFEIELSRRAGETIVSGLGLEAAPLGELEAAARALAADIAGADAAVVIRADEDVAYADVVRARDWCAAAGLERVGLE